MHISATNTEKTRNRTLFYIDPDTYFTSNFTMFAMRNAGKKYVKEILAKSKVNMETKALTEPAELGTVFTLGEYKAIQVLREQVICNPPVVKPVAVGKVGENKD